MVALAIASRVFGVLFTYLLRREVGLPRGEGVRVPH